ncbi:hypothetical protein RZS08_64405, partial [Arthrospira platensis SPKY1]|nr:hypothetical protein [Arthrospira platensis SPKY1]
MLCQPVVQSIDALADVLRGHALEQLGAALEWVRKPLNKALSPRQRLGALAAEKRDCLLLSGACRELVYLPVWP